MTELRSECLIAQREITWSGIGWLVFCWCSYMWYKHSARESYHQPCKDVILDGKICYILNEDKMLTSWTHTCLLTHMYLVFIRRVLSPNREQEKIVSGNCRALNSVVRPIPARLRQASWPGWWLSLFPRALCCACTVILHDSLHLLCFHEHQTLVRLSCLPKKIAHHSWYRCARFSCCSLWINKATFFILLKHQCLCEFC